MLKKVIASCIVIVVIVLVIIFSNKIKTQTNPESPVLGQVVTWGQNDDGQLGSGPLPENAAEVAAGKDSTYILDASGKVWSFGSNEHGQLGTTTKLEKSATSTVIALPLIAHIASTGDHVVFLDTEGEVWTVGSNFTGQLGSGSNKDTSIPYHVADLPPIARIAAGHKFTLAVTRDGEVYGWGAACDEENRKAMLIMLNTGADPRAKTNENGEGNYYNSLSTGEGSYNHAEDCLNENAIGIVSATPKKIEGFKNIADVSIGYGHALLLDKDGVVWTFGCNLYGQIGMGNFDNNKFNSIPKKITSLPKIKSISAGFRHSTVLAENGDVYSWGINARIDASGNTFNNATPIKVTGLHNITHIIDGRDYTLALDAQGQLFGWGNDHFGLLQDTKDTFIAQPIAVKKAPGTIVAVAPGLEHIVAIVKK